MKIRNGFVSNSSSSSFIVTNDEELDMVKGLNVRTFKVSELIAFLDILKQSIKKYKTIGDHYITTEDDECPSFVLHAFANVMNDSGIWVEYNDLIDLETSNPGCHITEEVSNNDYNPWDALAKLNTFSGGL